MDVTDEIQALKERVKFLERNTMSREVIQSQLKPLVTTVYGTWCVVGSAVIGAILKLILK